MYVLVVSPVRFDLQSFIRQGNAPSARNEPVRRDNLSPAISPLKYDFDEICEARALVRSGFQAEIAAKEPFDRWVSSHARARQTRNPTEIPFARADPPRKVCSQRHPQFGYLA